MNTDIWYFYDIIQHPTYHTARLPTWSRLTPHHCPRNPPHWPQTRAIFKETIEYTFPVPLQQQKYLFSNQTWFQSIITFKHTDTHGTSMNKMTVHLKFNKDRCKPEIISQHGFLQCCNWYSLTFDPHINSYIYAVPMYCKYNAENLSIHCVHDNHCVWPWTLICRPRNHH